MPRIFALLTGVKEYHPQSGVTSLSGCENDVNNIEALLIKQFGAANVFAEKLLSKQATREAFKETFVRHLINNNNIQPADTVLFYYSGHGSYAQSNPAFSEWDSEGRDETLVLYDSRCAGGFDLADKELRLLLSRIPTTNIIVIVDACHSGSITRNINDLDAILLGKAKHAPARAVDEGRKLPDYFTVNDSGYEQMLDEKGKAKLPPLRCITLSACDRTEVAYESSYSPEGMFTSMMLEALNAGTVNLSYSQLYEQLYTLLKRRARQQTPQLQVSGGFDVNTVVFGDAVAPANAVYQVVKENGKVTINCGALHGMKNDAQSMKTMAVSITDKDDPGAAATLAKITAVGLDNAELEAVAITPKVYQGTLLNLPPSVCIYVNAGEAKQKEWQQLAQKEKKEPLVFVYSKEQYHDYELKIEANSVTLSEPVTGRLIKQTGSGEEKALEYLLACCNKICDWHLLLSMNNYAMPEDALSETFQTEIGIELYNEGTQQWEPQKGSELVVYLDEQTDEIPLNMRLSTQSEAGWYCGVYYLNRQFGIQVCTNPVTESKLTKANPMTPLDGAGLSLDDDVDEMTDYLKLIISKDPFKDFLISEFAGFQAGNNEPGIGRKRTIKIKGQKIDQSWFVKTIAIKIVRRSGAIDSNTGFKHGKLIVHEHNALSGKASLSPVTTHAKSVHPADQLRQLVAENGFELINLETTKSANGASVVWVDNIEGAVSKEDPLKITLEETPADEEGVAAITIEDGVVQLIGLGSANREAGNYTIEIPVLPEDQQRKKKSLVRAAWFCFVKVVLKKDPSRLRKVVYKNGEVDYETLPANIVQPGMKVAVCIHGIIGNTKGMAASMQFLQTEKQYDLILAFDYENLNSKIEEIADTFKTLLGNAGVSKTAPVDIISHSMGGLVSRYMIEHIADAEGWVNRLFMFGTPNGGSVLGNIPKIRDWTVTVLTLACNFGGAALGTVGPVLSAVGKVLGATKIATNSLGQMAIDSDFYVLLNKPGANTGTTKYYIIAGNVLDFKPAADDGRFSKVMEKIKRQVGELLYSETNDIAVGVESILTLPQGINVTKQTFPGHHMNYFELAAPMNYFKTLV